MSKRLNVFNEKSTEEFNKTEENLNTKRKTELDVNLIDFRSQVKLDAMSKERRKWKKFRRLNLIHLNSILCILNEKLSENTPILRICSYKTKLCPNKRNTEVETKTT